MNVQTLVHRLQALPMPVVVCGVALLIALIAVAVIGSVATHTSRTPLFAIALHGEQLSEVERELAGWNVGFTPAADNVLVDAARRNDLLLRLSMAGVPHAHVSTTSEALADVGVLTPQAVIDAQTRAGLAGDIEIGLRSVAGVDDARVIIAPAKAAEFADESSRDASASVRLHLHPGASLGREAVLGIRRFVAASVAGLDPSHVTLLDDRGIALDDTGNAAGDSDALQRSLQSALDSALGAGVAIVRVHAEYSDAEVERRDVRRAPLSTLPIERNDDSESFDGGGKRYQKHNQHDDRGSDTREVVSKSAPGSITRLSAAVFLDASRALDVPRVRDLAAATIGYNARRGDSLVVQPVDFHHAAVVKSDGWTVAYGTVVSLLPSLIIGAVALFALKMAAPMLEPLVKELAERSSIQRASRTVMGYAPAQVRGALAHEPPHAAAAIISALPAATAAAVLELYPQHEREAIVRRMQRANSPIVPGAEEILGRHA